MEKWKVKSVLQQALINRNHAKLALEKAQNAWRDANKEVGKAFREERIAAGIGLREMAKKLEISAAYLSDIELGRRSLPEFWNLKVKSHK